MRHPKRAITRDIRTRRPKRIGREAAERETAVWPEAAVRVGDVMTRPVTTFRQEMTVGAAIKAMRQRKIRHAPVVDDMGALVGIVTDRDLRQAILEPAIREAFEELAQTVSTLTVKDVMTWGVITVKPETEIREAARLMHANKFGALPVVANGKVVGMLTGSDVLKSFVQMLDEGMISRPGRWGAEG
jgi:acetoin utilization protein AcuB